MNFLDIFFVAFIVVFIVCTRPLGEGQGFGRDTTASFRGLAMLGIILHHIHNDLGMSSQFMIPVGYLATGLFFFISGYGNMLSISKHDTVKFDWLYKKLFKIYTPYFVAYWLYLIVLKLIYPDLMPTAGESVKNLATLTLPYHVSWFPKIILLCFLIHWISKKLFKNVLFQNIFISVCILIYFTRRYLWEYYWFNSVLSYAVGCIFAKPVITKKLLDFLKDKKVLSCVVFFVLFAVLFGLSGKITILRNVTSTIISIALFYFSFIFTTKIKLYAWIGNNSFEFYVMHLLCLQLFDFLIPINMVLFAVAVILGSFVMVYIYLFIKEIINRKLQKN